MQNELIGQLKAEVHQNPDLTRLSGDQLRALITKNLENKVVWAQSNDPALYQELSDRKSVV